jgi:hypothetical protein
MINSWTLAFKQMEIEGRKTSDKNYATIWQRRMYKIDKFFAKIDSNIKRRQ